MEIWQIVLVVLGTIYLGVWLSIYLNTRHEVDPRQLVALAVLSPLGGIVTLIVSIVRACGSSASAEAAQTAQRAREARLRSEAEGLIGALWSTDREAGVQRVMPLLDRLETAERLSSSVGEIASAVVSRAIEGEKREWARRREIERLNRIFS